MLAETSCGHVNNNKVCMFRLNLTWLGATTKIQYICCKHNSWRFNREKDFPRATDKMIMLTIYRSNLNPPKLFMQLRVKIRTPLGHEHIYFPQPIESEGEAADGRCGSGVEPVSCYWKVAGLISLVCMSKCPWARYWTPNCPWCAVGTLHGSHLHQCMNTLTDGSHFGQKHLLNVQKFKWSIRLPWSILSLSYNFHFSIYSIQ